MTLFDRGLTARRGRQLHSQLAFALALLVSIAAGPGKTHAADDKTPTGRAVLLEEDPANPAGRKFPGSVVWHTDMIKSAGAPDEIFLIADVDIPDKLKMTLTLKRNTDKALPASHIIELTFVPVPGFAGHQIEKVPVMLMKLNELARGTALSGVTIKVTDNVFMIGLANDGADRERNLQTLKDRSWFDIPFIDGIQHRSMLAIEKGATGEPAFVKAMKGTVLTPHAQHVPSLDGKTRLAIVARPIARTFGYA